MSLKTDIISFISKLTWETVNGAVSWRFEDPPEQLTQGTFDLIPIYIQCHYKGKQRIGVYERRYRHYIDEDQFYWSSVNIFIIFDDYGRVIYESDEPDVRVNNLFSVARDNASNIGGVLKSLIEG